MEVWIWLGIIVILSIIEAVTVELVSVWFIASAIVSLILQVLGLDFKLCFIIFVLLGIVLMITTRKYLLKLLQVKKTSTNIDRIIGMKALVTKDIKDIGEVKVDGKIWTAVSDEINSTKLKVEKWSDK